MKGDGVVWMGGGGWGGEEGLMKVSCYSVGGFVTQSSEVMTIRVDI